jgi:hypothetical protein
LEVVGGVSEHVADIGDELSAASARDTLREWGNEIDAPEKAPRAFPLAFPAPS